MNWKVSIEATAFNSSQFPPENLPEVAMAGRSNVGKSSLINAILGSKLAHVGATPGKTRSINFYLVNAGTISFRLVDLPGYGYAERSKAERKDWSQLTSSYVENRGSLVLICHLADFRHGLLPNDRLLQEWLSGHGKPFMVLFTKADKISKGKRRSMLHQYVKDGLNSIDVPIITSYEERSGVEEARAFMENFVRRGM